MILSLTRAARTIDDIARQVQVGRGEVTAARGPAEPDTRAYRGREQYPSIGFFRIDGVLLN